MDSGLEGGGLCTRTFLTGFFFWKVVLGGGASVLERDSRARAKSKGLAGGLCRENMEDAGSAGSVAKGVAAGFDVEVLPLRRKGLWDSEAIVVAVGRWGGGCQC